VNKADVDKADVNKADVDKADAEKGSMRYTLAPVFTGSNGDRGRRFFSFNCDVTVT